MKTADQFLILISTTGGIYVSKREGAEHTRTHACAHTRTEDGSHGNHIYLTCPMKSNTHLVSIRLHHETMTHKLTISIIHNVTTVSMVTCEEVCINLNCSTHFSSLGLMPRKERNLTLCSCNRSSF